jgi:hypothetical protein
MDKRFTKKHAYTPGNNPAGPNANYYCHHCDLDIDGEEVGFVAAGTNYANGEHSPCPRCGEENFVERDENEDEISFGALIAAKVCETDEDNIKEEIWNRFMEKMKFVAEHGEEPILPGNFLGSVEKHKVQFMKINIRDLTK